MFYLYDPMYLKHDTGPYHPEVPKRLTAIDGAVRQAPWYSELELLESREAGPDTLSLVHDPDYIELARRDCEVGRGQLLTGDTAICAESFSIARHAAGGVLAAVDAVFGEGGGKAFCAVRPPGHHASGARGMGFCMFNNIAVAARYAQQKYNAERVLIADWDVHHGNGTQDIFYDDDSVLFMSTHQFPWYPGTGHFAEVGEGKGAGFTINRPFGAGAGDKEIITVFKEEFLPAARAFKPDVTFISAGFDSHRDDPLGGFLLTDDGFRELTRVMIEISDISGNGRLISVLEGGYNLDSLSSAVVAHMDELNRD